MSKIVISLIIGFLAISNVLQANPNPKFKPAQFKGGNEALQAFISQHLTYPEACRFNAIEGAVKVKLYFDHKGAIIRYTILEGVDELCNAEVERVIALMPNWKPAQYNGRKIPSKIIVSFRFQLQS